MLCAISQSRSPTASVGFTLFYLPCFQSSTVNNHGILLWSKLRLCTYMQGLCYQWLILSGLPFQRLCDKAQCPPESCTLLSCRRRFRLVLLSAAGSPIPKLDEGLIPSEAQSLKEKLSAELAAAHRRCPLGNAHAWDHLCSVWGCWARAVTSHVLVKRVRKAQHRQCCGTAGSVLYALGFIQVPSTEPLFSFFPCLVLILFWESSGLSADLHV